MLLGSLPAAKIIVEIAGVQCLDVRDSDNRTPLMLAAMSGHGELVNYFLAEGGKYILRHFRSV